MRELDEIKMLYSNVNEDVSRGGGLWKERVFWGRLTFRKYFNLGK